MSRLLTNVYGRPVNYSPSAGSSFDTCPRKWWFEKILGLQGKEDKSNLIYGTAVHLVIERYLKTGETIPVGIYKDDRDTVKVTADHVRRAADAFKHLPRPGTYRVEEWLPKVNILDTPEHLMPTAAKTDWFTTPADQEAPYHLLNWPSGVVAHVGDNKTGSDPKKNGKSSAQLAVNPQLAFYIGMMQAGGVIARGPVIGTHLNIQSNVKGDPKKAVLSYPTHAILTQNAVDDCMADHKIAAAEMADIGKGARTLGEQDSVRYKRSGCFNFGRPCPLVDVCNTQKKTTVGSTVSAFDANRTAPGSAPRREAGMGLLEDIKAKKAAEAAKNGGSAKVEPKAEPVKAPDPVKASAKPVNKSAISPPDAAPMDADVTTNAFLTDCVEKAREVHSQIGPEFSYDDLVELLKEESLHPDFWANVAVVVIGNTNGGGVFEALWQVYDRGEVSEADLLAGFPHTAQQIVDDLNAKHAAKKAASAAPNEQELKVRSLLSVKSSMAVFRKMALRADVAVLASALSLKGSDGPTDEQRAILTEALGASSGAEPEPEVEPEPEEAPEEVEEDLNPNADAANDIARTLDEKARVVFLALVGKDYNEEIVSNTMRSNGYQRVRADSVAAIVAALDQYEADILTGDGTGNVDESEAQGEREPLTVDDFTDVDGALARAQIDDYEVMVEVHAAFVQYDDLKNADKVEKKAHEIDVQFGIDLTKQRQDIIAKALHAAKGTTPKVKDDPTAGASAGGNSPDHDRIPVKSPTSDGKTYILVATTAQGLGFEPVSLLTMDVIDDAIKHVETNVKIEHNMDWTLFNTFGDTGAKRVAALVRSSLTREPLPPGWFTIDKANVLVGADILEVLKGAGAVVIRGLF